MNVFFIDFETTGLNPYHDEIIEFAIKLVIVLYTSIFKMPLKTDCSNVL